MIKYIDDVVILPTWLLLAIVIIGFVMSIIAIIGWFRADDRADWEAHKADLQQELLDEYKDIHFAESWKKSIAQLKDFGGKK